MSATNERRRGRDDRSSERRASLRRNPASPGTPPSKPFMRKELWIALWLVIGLGYTLKTVFWLDEGRLPAVYGKPRPVPKQTE